MAACFVLTMTSIPILQNLSILQPFLLPACFLAAAAAATSSGRLFVAGSLSGLATIKPQVALLPLAWLALWVGVDWRRRISFAWGFAITLAILLLASLWLLPGWLSEYPGILRAYAGYTQAHSLLSAALPPPLSWLVGVALGFVVGQVCWRARRQPPDSPAFAIALASVLALTVVTVPSMAQPFNQVLLLPTILLTLQHWQRLRQTSRATRMLASMLCLCLFLPWLLSPVAIANPFDPQRDRLDNLWALPLASDILLPFAAFCALMLLQKVTLVREGSK
jgi:hypothetical protein